MIRGEKGRVRRENEKVFFFLLRNSSIARDGEVEEGKEELGGGQLYTDGSKKRYWKKKNLKNQRKEKKNKIKKEKKKIEKKRKRGKIRKNEKGKKPNCGNKKH